jgi:hypothetical protein
MGPRAEKGDPVTRGRGEKAKFNQAKKTVTINTVI